jgi:hypothetical protein
MHCPLLLISYTSMNTYLGTYIQVREQTSLTRRGNRTWLADLAASCL